MPQLTPPRPMLRAAMALVALTFILAFVASRFGVAKAVDDWGTPVAQRALMFSDAPDGGIIVTDANSKEVVRVLPTGTNGFIRGALRGLADRRRVGRLSQTEPFVLSAWEDGRVSIEDPLTKERIAVSSFGPTQVASFVALLERTPKPAP